MQDTAKVNYVQYGKDKKKNKPGKSQKSTANGSSGGGHGMHGNPSKHGEKGKKLPLTSDICWRCGKCRYQKDQDCKAAEAVCRGCGTKEHFEKVCMKGKCSTQSVDVPQASKSSTGEPLYFDDQGQLIYAHMVSVQDSKKHLIKFPISLDFQKVKVNVKGNSTGTTVLLKADTGADVNVMNVQTFDNLFHDRKVLQLTPLRMEI